mgnify:CR=1 FL=1
MKFHKTYDGGVPLTVPRGPSKYEDLPSRGRLSLVEAYTLIKEKGLMVVPSSHAILRSGVPVTRLKLYLGGDKANWWCAKKAKRVVPSKYVDSDNCTFGPFRLCKGSEEKKGERTGVVNCGLPSSRRKRKLKPGSVNPRQPAPKNKKWVTVGGRAMLRHARGPRRKSMRASGGIDKGGTVYVKRFSEGEFEKFTDMEVKSEVKQESVTADKEERLRGLANRRDPLDGPVAGRRRGKRERKTSVPRKDVKTIITPGPVDQSVTKMSQVLESGEEEPCLNRHPVPHIPYSRGGAVPQSKHRVGTRPEESAQLMLARAMSIASGQGAQLMPTIATQGRGDCLIEACINQFHDRPQFGELCDQEPQFWRALAVNYIEDSERAFMMYSHNAAGRGSKLDQWRHDCKLLRVSGEFQCRAGDLMPLGLAANLCRNILVINVQDDVEANPFTVHLANTLGGRADATSPIVLCYDGNHYEGLRPVAAEDELQVAWLTLQTAISQLVGELKSGAVTTLLPDIGSLTLLLGENHTRMDGTLPELHAGFRLRLFKNLMNVFTVPAEVKEETRKFGRLHQEQQEERISRLQGRFIEQELRRQDGGPEVELQSRKRHKTCNYRALGLINQGNMCFVNATLKFLGAVPELREFLADTVPSEPVHHAIATAQELARIYRSTKPQESALRLQHLVANRSGQGHLSSGRQEDADEFIRALLDVLDRELRENQGYQRVRVLLHGQMSLQVKFKDSLPVGTCMKCKEFRPRHQQEEFLSLMLTVPITKQVLTVQSLLSNYLKDNDQHWISCPDCCRCETKCTDVGPCKQRAVTQRIVKKAPTVVLVHLLRFARGVAAPKVQTVVRAEPTVRLLDFMDYELEATLDHIGASLVSGHYVSKVRDGKGGGWQMHNDTAVTTIRPEAVTSRDNYFLMYRRKDRASAGDAATTSTSVGPAVDVTEQVRPDW